MLGVTQTLRRVLLIGANLNPTHAACLARGLKQNGSVEELQLQGNKIGDKGAEAIFDMLESNRTLREVWLNDNGIGVEGAKRLAKFLFKNVLSSSLTVLRFGSSKVGSDGAKAIADSMESNTHLTRLSYDGSSDEVSYYCTLNMAGRRLLSSPTIPHPEVWAHMLAKVGSIDRLGELRGKDFVYYYLRQKPVLLSYVKWDDEEERSLRNCIQNYKAMFITIYKRAKENATAGVHNITSYFRALFRSEP